MAFALWVVAVTLALTPLLFGPTVRLGPGTIEASIRPAPSGGTELSLPPLGAISAPTHRAPVRLGIELRELDVLGAMDPALRPDVVSASDPLPVIEAAVSDDLGAALARLALVLGGTAAACGAIAALAFPARRSPGRVLAGAAIGVTAVGVLVLPAAIGFDQQAFEDAPQLTGQLGSIEDLVARVGSLETPFGSVQSRTQVLSERIAGLYSAAITDEIDRSDGEVVLLHVSDLHLNAVGLSLARDLARSFDVDAVVDTGDITSFGFEPEARFVDELAGFQVPYYLVAGNHDSESVRRRLAESPDVISLDDEAVDIAGLRVLGIPDPTVTALRRIPRETLDRQYRDQFDTTEELVRSEDPDLVLVHNPVQLRPVLGQIPAAAAGHLHETRLEVVDGTVVAIVGSSGATGVGDLLVDEEAPYRFQLLRFVDERLVAVDQIELLGAGGDFELDRRLIRPDAAETDGAALSEEVDEPPRSEIDQEDLDRVTSTLPTTTAAPSTTAVGG